MTVAELRASPGDLTHAAVRASPAGLLTVALAAAGARPDDWQLRALSSTADRMVIVSGRQLGKGSVAAALALHDAAFGAGRLALVVSASERQARIVLERIRGMLPYIGPAAAGVEDTQTEIRFPSGSRIVVLPSTSTSLRGWTAHLLVLDEAAYIARASWESVIPTTAATGGRIVALTSAGAPAGWLHDIWTDTDTFPDWERIAVRASEVPRISADFLAAEARRLPRATYEREYECRFVGADDGVFDPASVDAAFTRPPGGDGYDWAGLDLSATLLGGAQ